MRVLVAMERSGIIRNEFLALGHNAWSCDLIEAEDNGRHVKGDMFNYLHKNQYNDHKGWDLIIAHPECTFLCSSGLHWNKKNPVRKEKTESALEFVCRLLNEIVKLKAINPNIKFCMENPIGIISTRIYGDWDMGFKIAKEKIDCSFKATQIIQPYNFGHDASKSTCLWLLNLPKLISTKFIDPRIIGTKKLWGNQTDSGQNKLGPNNMRWMERSRTYKGIAEAMAQQWSL